MALLRFLLGRAPLWREGCPGHKHRRSTQRWHVQAQPVLVTSRQYRTHDQDRLVRPRLRPYLRPCQRRAQPVPRTQNLRPRFVRTYWEAGPDEVETLRGKVSSLVEHGSSAHDDAVPKIEHLEHRGWAGTDVPGTGSRERHRKSWPGAAADLVVRAQRHGQS